ncbi:MAG: PIG-L family deacetylase, partial [Microbacterium sp.]
MAGTFVVTSAFTSGESAAAAPCGPNATMNFVAHEDDDLLFQNPEILQEVEDGSCLRTVYLTAGDAGDEDAYWWDREAGVRAAYASMLGVSNSWTQTDAGIAGHPIPVYTLNGAPNVSLAFMRLPDGAIDGNGFGRNSFESLQKLYAGTLDEIYTVDNSSIYTLDQLLTTLLALMNSYQPAMINTLDYTDTYGQGDHSDHLTVAYLTVMAQEEYDTPHGFAGYQGYEIAQRPSNVSGYYYNEKVDAFLTYSDYDWRTCNTASACAAQAEGQWLSRQYTVGTPIPA